MENYIEAAHKCMLEYAGDLLKEEVSGIFLAPENEERLMDVSAGISLSGEHNFILTLGYQDQVGKLITGKFMGLDPADVQDEFVSDVTGEIVNILAGLIKTALNYPDLKLSLPQIVAGESHHLIRSNSDVHFSAMEYTWAENKFWQYIQFQE